jgi:hypothetical protein
MRTIFARVKPSPLIEGDEIRICYTATRGGCSEAGYKVKKEDLWRPIREGETVANASITVAGVTREAPLVWVVQPDPSQPAVTKVPCSPEELAEVIAEKLKDAIARVWQGDQFRASRRNNELILTCAMDDQTFFPMLNGTQMAGESIIEIESL